METTREAIQFFFKNYEAIYNRALNSDKVDPKATMECFAPYFVESSPKGIIGAENGEEFEKNIIKGFKFYKSIGTTAMKILGEDVVMLNQYHAAVTAHWEAAVTKKDGSELKLAFDVIYLMQIINGKIKIFAYIAEDEQQIYKDHQIEPYK